jgi:hypothetical protein
VFLKLDLRYCCLVHLFSCCFLDRFFFFFWCSSSSVVSCAALVLLFLVQLFFCSCDTDYLLFVWYSSFTCFYCAGPALQIFLCSSATARLLLSVIALTPVVLVRLSRPVFVQKDAYRFRYSSACCLNSSSPISCVFT